MAGVPSVFSIHAAVGVFADVDILAVPNVSSVGVSFLLFTFVYLSTLAGIHFFIASVLLLTFLLLLESCCCWHPFWPSVSTIVGVPAVVGFPAVTGIPAVAGVSDITAVRSVFSIHAIVGVSAVIGIPSVGSLYCGWRHCSSAFMPFLAFLLMWGS